MSQIRVLPRTLAWWHGARALVVILALSLIGLSSVVTGWMALRSPDDPRLVVWLGVGHLSLLALIALLMRRSHGDYRTIRELNRQLQESLVHERGLARTDGLTGLLNFRAFNEELVRERARSRRNRETLTLAYIDLDQFKKVNDMLGHGAGDELLKNVAQIIKDSTRAEDLAARVGGDEFAVLFHATSLDLARDIAQRISAAVERLTAVRFSPPLGASIGLYEIRPNDMLSASELVGRADRAMYETKTTTRRQDALALSLLPRAPRTRVRRSVLREVST